MAKSARRDDEETNWEFLYKDYIAHNGVTPEEDIKRNEEDIRELKAKPHLDRGDSYELLLLEKETEGLKQLVSGAKSTRGKTETKKYDDETYLANACREQGKIFVSGYRKEDGTYVHGHCKERER